MIRSTSKWDVRCPRTLTRQFPERTGYYYRVTRVQARRVVRALCRAYDVPVHKVCLSLNTGPGAELNGCCTFLPDGASIIEIHGRAHLKTVFHEFYHSLDHYTGGKYNSSDKQGGDASLAWQFADRLFEVFRHQRPKEN